MKEKIKFYMFVFGALLIISFSLYCNVLFSESLDKKLIYNTNKTMNTNLFEQYPEVFGKYIGKENKVYLKINDKITTFCLISFVWEEENGEK